MKLPKKIVSYENALDSINKVIDDFTNTVVSTLGPLGQTVILGTDSGEVPHVTKDGVTVSESIYYLNPLFEAIATLLKESARKTNEEVGDGTTTATLLACKLIVLAMKQKKASFSFREYLDGIEKAIDYVVEFLQEETVPVTMNSPELQSVINISSNGDSMLANMLIGVTQKVGEHGIIDVRLSNGKDTAVNISKGAMIETNVPVIPGQNKVLEVDGIVSVILIDGKITDIPTIENALKSAATTKYTTLIVASEFSENVIANINTNNQRGATNIVLAISEGFGKAAVDILTDLSVITGARIMSTAGSTNYPLRAFQLEDAGTIGGLTANAREVILHCYPHTIEAEVAKTRFAELVTEFEDYKRSSIVSSAELNIYKKRMSKYVSVATINVGGITKAEAGERKDRFDDAVHAVSAAVNNGVLPGGGASLIRAAAILEARKEAFTGDGELQGMKDIVHLCYTPLHALAKNAGFKIHENQIKNLTNSSKLAYDIIHREVINAFEGGILDPALVVTKALENALAIMRSIVNSSGFIVNDDGEI